jgi:hypothetical protein
MKRAGVLQLLCAHLDRPLDAHEAAMTAQIVAFVEAHEDCFERGCLPGHLTGSAWVVDPRGRAWCSRITGNWIAGFSSAAMPTARRICSGWRCARRARSRG